jgi:hypothetical protein
MPERGVPVILVDGPSAGQLIYTYPAATAWRVAKPLEPIPCMPSIRSGDWYMPEPNRLV